jgi:uncharacterized protein GlcG (DUF336 family)
MQKLAIPSFIVAPLLLASSAAVSQQPAPSPAPAPRLDLGQVRPMTVQYAKQLVAAAIKATCAPPAGQCSGAFAIADDAGVIVYMETLDGVLAGGPDLAMRKATTSALWRRPTQVFADAVAKGTNMSYADGTFSNMTTSPGGVPILREGRVVGGFGQAAVGSNAVVKQVSDAVAAEAARIFGKQ